MAIVEDHVLQRERTQQILGEEDGLTLVGSFETLPDFTAWFETAGPRRRPHLLVLDLVVDRRDPADPADVRRLVDQGVRVLVLSAMASPPLVREMLKAGVTGVVGKHDSTAAILEAVWSTMRRESWMTPELAAVIASDGERPELSIQEERSLALYASGLTLPDVAAVMNVKPDTAKSYLARVKAKYADIGRPVRTKIDLRRAAESDGFLE